MPWISPAQFAISTALPPDKILELSPLARAAHLTFGYLADHGPVGLTKSGALNRKFLHWAAESFDWPGQEHEELFFFNKVLNEIDFPACGALHQILHHLKLVRVWKGTLKPTKVFLEIGNDPAILFERLAPVYLTQMDHRFGELIGHMDGYSPEETQKIWAHELKELSSALAEPKSGAQLAGLFFDGDERSLFNYYLDILRPMVGAGCLRVTKGKNKIDTSGMVFEKTELLPSAPTRAHPHLRLVP